jgi:hypothetical protein
MNLVVARSPLVVARSPLVVARSPLVVARSPLVVARSPDRATCVDRRSPGTSLWQGLLVVAGSPDRATCVDRRSPGTHDALDGFVETCGQARGTVRRPCHNRGVKPVARSGDRATTGNRGASPAPSGGPSQPARTGWYLHLCFRPLSRAEISGCNGTSTNCSWGRRCRPRPPPRRANARAGRQRT